MNIVLFGLKGSGKTTLARELTKDLKAYWLNADKIRKKYNDWDFSKNGIIRQVKRMKSLSDKSNKKYVVADFVCPLHIQTKIFKPNFIVWMDTIKKSRFSSMNKIVEKQKREIKKTQKQNNKKIPQDLKYNNIPGLSNEVKEKLIKHKPETIGRASKIEGVTPAAVNLILIQIKKKEILKQHA